MNSLPLGLSTYGLGLPLRPRNLERLAEAGFSCIEYASLFYHPDVEPARLGRDIGTAAGKAGMSVWSVHGPLDEGTDISSLDEMARRHAVGRMVRTISLAEACGARWLVVHCSHPLGREDHRGMALSQALRSINELFKRGSQRGVGIAIENNPGPFIGNSPEELQWILDTVDGEIGLCVDTGHANITGHLYDLLGSLGPRIATVHLSDNGGQEDDHWLPGAGTINWPQVGAALKAAGYGGPLIWELAPSVVEQVGDFASLAEVTRAALMPPGLAQPHAEGG